MKEASLADFSLSGRATVGIGAGILLSEATSNTASATMLVPVMIASAQGAGSVAIGGAQVIAPPRQLAPALGGAPADPAQIEGTVGAGAAVGVALPYGGEGAVAVGAIKRRAEIDRQ